MRFGKYTLLLCILPVARVTFCHYAIFEPYIGDTCYHLLMICFPNQCPIQPRDGLQASQAASEAHGDQSQPALRLDGSAVNPAISNQQWESRTENNYDLQQSVHINCDWLVGVLVGWWMGGWVGEFGWYDQNSRDLGQRI